MKEYSTLPKATRRKEISKMETETKCNTKLSKIYYEQ